MICLPAKENGFYQHVSAADRSCRFQKSLGFVAARSFDWHLKISEEKPLQKLFKHHSAYANQLLFLIFEHINQMALVYYPVVAGHLSYLQQVVNNYSWTDKWFTFCATTYFKLSME
jgi:hypothetical protein